MRRRNSATHPFTDASRGVRLQKVLADAGVAARRACEELIESGAVSVNGTVVDSLPAWVDPAKDRISVGGKPVRTRTETRRRYVYVLLHKPRGYVCTNSDPEGRPRASDLVEHPTGERLYPVGRLDMDSSGLLLLTNDGELANRLTHPRYEVHKGYEVTVRGEVSPEEVRRLEHGIFLPDRDEPGQQASASSLRILKRDRERTLLMMELREGRNRQIRRMMLRLGHPVRKLKRVRMGPLQLRKLAVGAWRDLTPEELASLRAAAFVDAATLRQRTARSGGGTGESRRRAAGSHESPARRARARRDGA
jgi:23S rRNA pseudouridine2605 synthase